VQKVAIRQARFCIRGFASECSCRNKPHQNSQCQDAQTENTLLVGVIRIRRPFGVTVPQATPSVPDPNQRMKFLMHRRMERNTAKEKIQMTVANASAILSLGPQVAMRYLLAELPNPALSTLTRTHPLLGSKPFAVGRGPGLGVSVVLETDKSDLMRRGNVGTVSWPGAYGAWWQADPKDGSVLIFLAHNVANLDQMTNGIGLGVWGAIGTFQRLAS